MTTGAAAMMLQCVTDGTLSMHDIEIERRPYHRNCGCALHKLKGDCANTCSQHKNISYPKKQSWNDCSLSIVNSRSSSQSSLVNESLIRYRKDAHGASL